ncbi:hypothetical protein [Halocynthiibacter sp.]|uniref:hypothetical protein n=1 Tax=Halocynthiibacter sp. TaxID=1979210 RepID=UPI003C66C749
MDRFLIASFNLACDFVIDCMIYYGSAMACAALWFMIIGNGGATTGSVPGFTWYLRSLPLFLISSVCLIFLLEYFRANRLKIVLWTGCLSIVAGGAVDDPEVIRNGNEFAQSIGLVGRQYLNSVLSWLLANWAVSIIIFGFLEHDRRSRELGSGTTALQTD